MNEDVIITTTKEAIITRLCFLRAESYINIATEDDLKEDVDCVYERSYWN